MQLTLFVDLERRMLVGGLNDPSAADLPDLMQGDTVDVVLQGVEKNTSTVVQYYRAVPISFGTIKCAITSGADVAPTDGTICLGLVGGAAGDVTTPFAPGIAKPALADLLNALPGVVAKGGVKVLTTNAATNIFRVRWNSPTETALFEFRNDLLEPPSDTRSYVVPLPNGQMQLLKYRQLPLAFTDQFALPVAPVVTAASVRTGTNTRNCIQSITVPRGAVGSAHFTFGTLSTAILPVTLITAAAVAGALNDLFTDSATRFSVTQASSTVFYVEFVGPLAQTDFPVLGVTMHDQVLIETPTARLPLNGPTLEMAFDGTASIDRVLEIEITDTDGEVGTPIQTEVSLRNDVIDGGMSLASDPNWQAPIDPTYPPYDPNGATIVAPGAYVTPVGSGASVGTSGTSFVVTHNLHTQNVLVGVRETGGSHHRIPDNQYVCTILNDDEVQVDFPVAPTDGQYEIIIAAVVPGSMALPHHTHPISDVEGLEEALENLGAEGSTAPLPASRLPAFIPWFNTDANGRPTTPKFDPVPDQLIPANIPRLPLTAAEMPPGTPFIGPDGGLYVTLPGPPPLTVPILDPTGHVPIIALPTDLTNWPGLFTAIISALQAGAPIPKGFIPMTINPLTLALPPDAEVREGTVVPATLPRALPGFAAGGNVSGALPAPDAANKGKVYTVAGTPASAAAARYRAPQYFPVGTFVGCDGNQYYPVYTEGADAFPSEMDVDLFTVHLAGNMLANSTRFAASAQVQLSLSGPAAAGVRAVYVLRLRFGTVNGPYLSSITWAADFIAQPLVISDAGVIHQFEVAVQRATNGSLTATAGFYGRDASVTAPAAADFVLRASLSRFDIEDVDGLAVGQVNVSMKSATASVAQLPA